MHDVSEGIWIIACVIAIFAALAFAATAAEALFRRRWKRAGLMTVIAGLCWGVLRLAALPLEARSQAMYIARIFDAKAKLKRPFFTYDSGRSIHGDGFSLAVYEIPAEIRKRFEAADERLREYFPQLSEHRREWRTVGWREAPLDPELRKYVNFALCSYDQGQSTRVAAEFDSIRTALTRRRTHYGLRVYDHGESPGNVDLYIVDLDGGRLYIINHNT